MYPIEVEIGKRKELGGPESTACFHLPLELQLDCPEAKTCGCQSSILSVTVDGSLVVMRSRLDEISDVFEADSVFVNLTLCKLPSAPGAREPLETRSEFYAIDVTLEHSSSGDTLALVCRNISLDAVKDCAGGSGLRSSEDANSASSVVVESVSSASEEKDAAKEEEEQCAQEGRCSDDSGLDLPQRLRLANEKSRGGDVDGALRVLRRAEARGMGGGPGSEEGGSGQGVAGPALHQLALLPTFAWSRRCCDSVNEYCKQLPASHKYASLTSAEEDLLSVFGRDQCEGVFVEVGAGDGVSDSPTLFLEKMMGWTGILIEGDAEKFRRLEGSGRGGSTLLKGELAVKGEGISGGGLDLKEEISKVTNLGDETQQVQVVFVNTAPERILPTLHAIDLAPAKGYMGMLLPLASCIAVLNPQDPALKAKIEAYLEEQHYRVVKSIGKRRSAQGPEEGKTYELFMHMPPMDFGEQGPAGGGGEWDGPPEIEYHVSHDDDDDDDDE